MLEPDKPPYYMEQLLPHLYMIRALLNKLQEQNFLSEDIRVANLRLQQVLTAIGIEDQFYEFERKANLLGINGLGEGK